MAMPDLHGTPDHRRSRPQYTTVAVGRTFWHIPLGKRVRGKG